MKHDLWRLRHARYRFGGEEAELINVPGILVGLNEVAAIIGILDFIQEELAVRLDRVDAS